MGPEPDSKVKLGPGRVRIHGQGRPSRALDARQGLRAEADEVLLQHGLDVPDAHGILGWTPFVCASQPC
eukprot:7095097-Alexandrium_andersonii.AAC.1